MGPERVVGPFFRLRRNDISVGVEQDGGQVRVGTGPLEKDDGFVFSEFEGLRF